MPVCPISSRVVSARMLSPCIVLTSALPLSRMEHCTIVFRLASHRLITPSPAI